MTTHRPDQPPRAWRGADMRANSDWKIPLTPAHNRELRQALAHARANGKGLVNLNFEETTRC